MKRDKSGKLKSVTMYHDPEHDFDHDLGLGMGLGVGWYLLPYNSELAYEMYHAAVESLGLYNEKYDPADWVQIYARQIMFIQLALCMSVEFGEEKVEARLREVIEVLAEPRHFGDGCFGYFYNLNEPWPRGQMSALLMASEVMTPGGWQRVFNNVSYKERFLAPTVEGVEFPALSLSRAWNDPQMGTLTVSTVVGSPSKAGQPTNFKVSRLPHTANPELKVTRDGELFLDWTALNASTIQIRTMIGCHTFVIFTGYIGGNGSANRSEILNNTHCT